jgi:hypothetical protein
MVALRKVWWLGLGGGVAILAAASCTSLAGLSNGGGAGDAGDGGIEGATSGEGAGKDATGAEASADASNDASNGCSTFPVPPNAAACEDPAAVDANTVQLCDGSTTFVANDMNNCGQCGKSCLGGSCGEGQCGPSTIFQERNDGGMPTNGALVVAVTGGSIYWTYETDPIGLLLRQLPLDGGTMQTYLTITDVATSLAIDPYFDHAVYYVINHGGGGSQVLYAAHPPAAPVMLGPLPYGSISSLVNGADFAFDEAYVWISDRKSNIYRLPRDATGAVSTLGQPWAQDRSFPISIVSSPPYVAWIEAPWTANVPSPEAGTPTAASKVYVLDTTSAAGPQAIGTYIEPSSLAVDPASGVMFWFDAWTSEVYAAQPCASDLTPVSQGVWTGSPEEGLLTFGMLPMSPHAYVGMMSTDYTLHGIVQFGCGKSPSAVCGPGGTGAGALCGDMQEGQSHIAMDDTAFYWGQYGGAVLRMVR